MLSLPESALTIWLKDISWQTSPYYGLLNETSPHNSLLSFTEQSKVFSHWNNREVRQLTVELKALLFS